MGEKSETLKKTRDKIMIKLKEMFDFEQMKVYSNPYAKSFVKEAEEPEHFGGGKNIEVLGYETKHFDICASAVSLYTKLNKVDNEEAKEYIVQSAKDLDHIFEMEKAVVRKEPLNHDPIKHGVELVNTVSFRLGYVAKLIDDDFMDETLFMPYHIEVMVDRIDDIKIDKSLDKEDN